MENLSSVEAELQRIHITLSGEFEEALPQVASYLSPEELLTWAREGVSIARHSFRSWEAALEYFRVTPRVLERLQFCDFLPWVGWGRILCDDSFTLSCAYFRASPEAVCFLLPQQIGDWVRLGRSFYQGTWKSGVLASRFFEASSRLFRHLSLEEIEQLATVIHSVSKVSSDQALDFLALAEEVLPGIEKQDRLPFLKLACFLTESDHKNARVYFAAGPKIVSPIEPSQRGRFLSLAEGVAQTGGDPCSFLLDCSRALGGLEKTLHHRLLDLFEGLVGDSTTAAIEFLKSCPIVLERIKVSELDHWYQEGMDILRQSREGGEAYFRLQSSKGEETIERLSTVVELERVERVLGMYSRALTGKDVQILPVQKMKEKGIGWTYLEKPTTEGRTIFLPSSVERFNTKEENFAWYKVVTTHQAAHIEFGSFDFSFEREASLFADLRHRLANGVWQGITDLERFFNLFSDRRLAADIFTAVEDMRVDHLVKEEYQGLRKVYQRVQKDALRERPPLNCLPLREAFIETLVLMSLGEVTEVLAPTEFHPYIQMVAQIARGVKSLEAKVEDSAEATIRIYTILSQVANQVIPAYDWSPVDLSHGPDMGEIDRFCLSLSLAGSPSPVGFGGEELPYSPPQEVEYRGEFKPELVQLLIKLRELRSGEGAPAMPISREALKELLGKGVEIIEIVDSQLLYTTGLHVTDLWEEAGSSSPGRRVKQQGEAVPGEGLVEGPLEVNEPLSFLYDEWDFRAADYRPRWCCVREKTMAEGTADLFETTLQNYSHLAAQVKKQFEFLAPELFKKIKGLHDGEEYELDAVIEAIVQRRAGAIPDDKVYWRRNKTERSVAAVFLLDMSASTSEAIEEIKIQPEDSALDDPWRYLMRLRTRTMPDSGWRPYKKIIDVERESAVLLMWALEAIGDTYGIYGFSGYGRDNVEFFVIKDIEEEFSERVKKRISKISPLHATRMGPAIRHATSKLERQQAKTKMLFLISDGRPQDYGYGRDGVEKDYAIHDTKMAFIEAKRKGIVPFCLTVDREGHDYLKKMCTDMGYEVVCEIESLPARLPALYRKLTI